MVLIHILLATAKPEGNKWCKTIKTGTHGVTVSPQRQRYISSAKIKNKKVKITRRHVKTGEYWQTGTTMERDGSVFKQDSRPVRSASCCNVT